MSKTVLYLIVGVMLVAHGLLRFFRAQSLKKNVEIVDGVVFRVDPNLNPLDSTEYDIIIRFVTKEELWITEKLVPSKNRSLGEGDKVKIVYKRHDPKDFDIYSKFNRTIGPIISMGIGLAFITLGILVYLGLVEFEIPRISPL